MGVLILNPGVSSLELKKFRTFSTDDCKQGLEGTWEHMEDSAPQLQEPSRRESCNPSGAFLARAKVSHVAALKDSLSLLIPLGSLTPPRTSLGNKGKPRP